MEARLPRLPPPRIHQRDGVQPDRHDAAHPPRQVRDGGAGVGRSRAPRPRGRARGQRVHLARVARRCGTCERCRVIVERTPAALSSAREDFGHVLQGSPAGLVHPRTIEDVEECVADAIASGSRLTLRGAGHSAGGQALPVDSVAVDLSRLDRVEQVDPARGTITCQAGALLRDVASATLEHRLLPRALTNLLDLTVGGLLSVGGVGPGSHRHGPLVANVATLEVVAGDGYRRRCSRKENRELFDAVLGGLGRCGVIVSAELELRPVRPRVRTYHLLYDDLRLWMTDQRTLAHMVGVGSMEGFCSPSMQGLRGTGGRRAGFAEWFFPLQVSFEFDEM